MIKMLFSLLLSAAFMASATGIVKETIPKSDKPVKTLLKKYRSQGPIQIKFRKVLKSEFAVKDIVSEGVLQIKKDRLRLKLDGANGMLTVIDGKNIWIENKVESTEKEGKIITQVTKLKLNAARKEGAILSLLFSDSSELKDFRFVSTETKDGKSSFLYHPAGDDAKYQELKIIINEKEGRIDQLVFLDNLENLETYTFGVTEFKAKLKSKVFTYKPPKGADVNEI